MIECADCGTDLTQDLLDEDQCFACFSLDEEASEASGESN